MINIRVRNIMIIVSVFTILFVLYQLSSSEPKHGNSRDGSTIKDTEKSLGLKGDNNMKSLDSSLLLKLNDHTLMSQYKADSSAKDFKTTFPSLFGGQKIVHLDLKGAPPKVSYYEEFFPLIQSLGATGILIEYEDMFPYSMKDIPAGNSYSRSDIRTILKLASDSSLDVIPLVQTFGHLEFVLKLKEHENLREVPKYPQVICPTRNATSNLLKNMIDDIVAMHPNSRYLHIGCDEVYNLGECSQCVDKMLKNNWTKKQLFLSHVTMIARYIKEKYPNVKPLTWDDEFRQLSLQDLQASGIGSLLEPVVWKYTPNVETDLPGDIWDKYAVVFGSVWIASAFKGAIGADRYFTDINYYLENHRSWMRLVSSLAGRVSFKGIMMTGWQRYDHFAVLCELLPVGLPSLAVNLAYLSQNDLEMHSVPRLVQEKIGCGQSLIFSKRLIHCRFPGSDVFEKANQLSILMDRVQEIEETSEAKGWLSDYNILAGFSNPAHVEGATTNVNRYILDLQFLEQDVRTAMKKIFDMYTVNEWITTFINPSQKRLQAMWDAREKLLANRVWPRRPLLVKPQNIIKVEPPI